MMTDALPLSDRPRSNVLYTGLARTMCIYTVYVRYFWQGNHHIYGHIRCIYTVLANPSYTLCMHGKHLAKNHACFFV